MTDGGIKGPANNYNNERIPENSGIRRLIWEYAVTLERILLRTEEAGLTISGNKFACCVPSLDIVGHIVSYEGRCISKKKVNKVANWPRPRNDTEVRKFLGLVAYVRMFIKNLSQLAAPLRKLTWKDAEFIWDDHCGEAFNKLKLIISQDITLKKLDYSPGAGKIKLAVDSSCIAAGGVLTQQDENGLDRPVFYESLVFSKTESKYSQPKLELCGVARMLKKFQVTPWGQHFQLLMDAK